LTELSGMLEPAFWIALTASSASVGVVALTGVPAPASVAAIRAAARTWLVTPEASLIRSDISMMPKTRSISRGVTRAASTATAPRSERCRRAMDPPLTCDGRMAWFATRRGEGSVF
jgi:hypothetical protein